VAQTLPQFSPGAAKEAHVFGRKFAIGDDLYEKLKKCSETAGYSSPEEFALHVLEKEVDRILGGGGGDSDEEIIKKRLQGLGYID
jgi:predicted CopG family antitoxin